jgi:hypothetical protein
MKHKITVIYQEPDEQLDLLHIFIFPLIGIPIVIGFIALAVLVSPIMMTLSLVWHTVLYYQERSDEEVC